MEDENLSDLEDLAEEEEVEMEATVRAGSLAGMLLLAGDDDEEEEEEEDDGCGVEFEFGLLHGEDGGAAADSPTCSTSSDGSERSTAFKMMMSVSASDASRQEDALFRWVLPLVVGARRGDG